MANFSVRQYLNSARKLLNSTVIIFVIRVGEMSKRGGLTFTALAILLVVTVSLSVVSQESGSEANVSELNFSDLNSSDAVVSQANESLAGSDAPVGSDEGSTTVADSARAGAAEANGSSGLIEPQPRAQNLVRKVVSDARIHAGAVAQVQSEGSASVIVLLADVDSGRSASAQGVAVSRERAGRAKQAFRESLAGKGISDASVSIEQELYTVGAVAMTVDEAGLAALQENPLVARVLPNGKRSISRGTISDAGISLNESAPVINSDDVANLTVNGSNLTGHGEIVCVIDTGIDTSHLLFGPVIEASNIVGGIFGGYDFVNNDTNASDDNNHGTHVSGIAVGNFSPYFGTARNAQVVPVKVCDAAGSCPDFAILAGVDYCNNNISGVTVISGSLGGGAPLNSSTCSGDPLFASLEVVLNESLNNGIIPVFASGNNGCGAGCTTGVDYPACSPQVISVGSTTKADAISTFTDRGGDRFDIYAPGQSITSSVPTFNAIQSVSGTSQATPHVSGVIAVLQQNERLQGRARLNLTTIRRLLQETGVPIPSNDSRVDVLHAIARLNANFSLNQTANLVRDVASNSSIQFYSASDLGQVLGCVEVRENFAGVNSTDCPQYNKSAHVVLGGVTNPAQPYVDGAPCPLTVCQNVTLTSKGLEMDVTGFSNFTSVPGCGIMINESASLNQSINATATCITFGADNIELDCNGFTIGYANESLGYGINATGRKNITIRNCVVNQSSPINNAHAIFLSGTNNSVITNASLNVTQSPGQAVYIEGSEEVVVGQSRFGSAAQGNGVYVTGSENVTVRDNNFISAGQAIGFDSSVRLVAVNNSASIIGNSIALAAGGLNQGSLIENNSISGNQNRALFFSGGNAVARNNVLVSQSLGDAVELNEVDGNVTLEHNVIYAQGTGQALYLRDANSSRFVNNTVRGPGGGALLIIDGALNVFENSSFATDSGTATVYFSTLAGSVVNNTFTNITLESNGSYIRSDAAGAGNNFTAARFFNASAGSLLIPNFTLPASGTIGQENLSIRANFTFVNASALSFLNASAQITFDNLPFVNPRPLVDFDDGGVFEKCSEYPGQCDEVSYNGSTFIFNVSSFTSYAASETVLSCPETIVEDTVLNQSLNATGSCIHFGADNIELDCAGFSIDASLADNGTAVNATGRRNVTVRNCVIVQSNSSNGNAQGLLFSDTNGSSIVNTTINMTGLSANGFTFDNAYGNSIGLLTLYSVNTGGVITSNSVNASIENSFLNASGGVAINVGSSSPFFTMRNTTARSGSNGLVITGGSENAVIVNNTLVGLSGGIGMQLADSNTLLDGNLFYGESGNALLINSGSNISMRNNVLISTGAGNVLSAQGSSNLFVNNTVVADTGIALRLPATFNNSFANMTVQANGGIAVGAEAGAENNSFTNVTLRANGTWVQSATTAVNQSFTQARFDNFSAGNLFFDNFTLPGDSLVGQSNLSVGANTTFLNSSQLPFLNVSAQITLRSLPFNNPLPLVDENDTGVFLPCDSSRCTVISSGAGIIVFNVTGFTSYAASEGGLVTIVKEDSSDPVKAGALLNYTLTINSTQGNQSNATVTEFYPAEVSFVSASPAPTSGNNTFSLGTLVEGVATTINITVRVGYSVANGTILNNTANVSFVNSSGTNFSAVVSEFTTVLNEFANVSVTKDDVPDPVPRGGTLNYTVLLVNNGNVNASNITVVESYPENVSFVSSTPAPTSGNNTFVIAELAPNENTTVNITLAVGTGIGNGSVLNNSVLVTYVNQSGDNATALAATQTTVLGAANVTIAKSDVPDPVLQGEQLSYQLVVNNTGDDVAVNVTITETYPPNISVVTSSPLPDAGNNTFIVGNLSPGQTATVNITLLVGPAVTNGTVLNNSANASWENRTGDVGSVIASELTTVLGRANLSTNKTANESFVIRGNTVNFTIVINNSGDDTAFNLTVTEIYPVQGSFVSASPAPSAGNATFSLGGLEPNGSVVVEISLNLTGANGTQVQNSYNVTFQRRNGSTVNLTNASSVTLLGFPVVAVAKTDSADPTSAGATLRYAVTVTNNGDDIAYNVTVVEGYPLNVTLNGTEPNATSGNDTFAIGNLLPGQSFTMNISVNVSSAMALGSLNNSVNVTFANASGVNLTQAASQITAVSPPAAPFVQGGGGGGGGGASGVSTTQSMTGSSWSSAYLRAGDKVKFTANDAIEHTMTVLTVLTDRVTIRVASVPQEFTIKKGVVQAVDVTGDGKDDVRISVVDIAYSKALFHLEKAAFSPAVVRDAVPAPVPSPAPAVGQKEEAPLVQPAPQEREEFTAVVPQGESEGSGGIGKWVVSAIVVLAIAGVLVAAVRLRKPKEPDALASAQEIEAAFRDMKSGMKESMQLVRKAERSERKK